MLTIIDNMITDYITEPGIYDKFNGDRVFVAVPGVDLRLTDTLHYLAISPNAGMGKTEWSGARGPALFVTAWMIGDESYRSGSDVGKKYMPVHFVVAPALR